MLPSLQQFSVCARVKYLILSLQLFTARAAKTNSCKLFDRLEWSIMVQTQTVVCVNEREEDNFCSNRALAHVQLTITISCLIQENFMRSASFFIDQL